MLPIMYWCISFYTLGRLVLHKQLELSICITVGYIRKYIYKMYSMHQLMKIVTSIHGRILQM